MRYDKLSGGMMMLVQDLYNGGPQAVTERSQLFGVRAGAGAVDAPRMTVFIGTDPDEPMDDLAGEGIVVNQASGTIRTADLPLRALEALSEDPRVTRIGRFIRKASLDELPQLFNVVFKGNLSLVGPRPHAVNAKAEARLYDEAVDGYFARHRVKPGITGWAQINGWRGETDTHEKIQQRVEHDLYYIENWSVLFDLYIVARTPFALLKTENAY